MDILSTTVCATQISENEVRVSLRVLGTIYTKYVFELEKKTFFQGSETKKTIVLKS